MCPFNYSLDELSTHLVVVNDGCGVQVGLKVLLLQNLIAELQFIVGSADCLHTMHS